MNIQHYLRISTFVNDCPNCGYDRVGTEDATDEFHGALIVDDNLFTRKCRCGFEITIDANNGTTKTKIKKQIDAALMEFTDKAIGCENSAK